MTMHQLIQSGFDVKTIYSVIMQHFFKDPTHSNLSSTCLIKSYNTLITMIIICNIIP